MEVLDSNQLQGTKPWKTMNGDSYLYFGDSLELMATIPDNTVDCVWTDPPYFLSNDGITCVAGRMVKVNKGEWDRSNGLENDHDFHLTWLSECYRILKPTGTIWVTGTLHVYLSVGMAMLQTGFRILNDITWEKPNPPPNLGCRCFTHSTETILWATKAKKGSKHRYTFNYEEMREENGGKQMKSVWRYPPPGRDEKKHGKHPTQKPVALIERCLRASTNAGDLVFDPFAGSGATGLAAIGMGRKFIGCEREQEYADLIVRRLSSFGAIESYNALAPYAKVGEAKTTQPRLLESKTDIKTLRLALSPRVNILPSPLVSCTSSRMAGSSNLLLNNSNTPTFASLNKAAWKNPSGPRKAMVPEPSVEMSSVACSSPKESRATKAP